MSADQIADLAIELNRRRRGVVGGTQVRVERAGERPARNRPAMRPQRRALGRQHRPSGDRFVTQGERAAPRPLYVLVYMNADAQFARHLLDLAGRLAATTLGRPAADPPDDRRAGAHAAPPPA